VEQKQTSTERVKAHQARQKQFKQALDEKGYTTVSLIIKKDQVFRINNSTKMLNMSAPQILHSITQGAIAEFCQKHDDILIRNAQAELEMLGVFAENQDLNNIITGGKI
jgi:hypothetical protein